MLHGVHAELLVVVVFQQLQSPPALSEQNICGRLSVRRDPEIDLTEEIPDGIWNAVHGVHAELLVVVVFQQLQSFPLLSIAQSCGRLSERETQVMKTIFTPAGI